jgi:8-oxo-dGTP pyrophosphatase MutT (NUDIX family)
MNYIRFKLLSAVHLFLIKDSKILLLRRFNTGYEDGNYSVPAGHLDGNESVIKAMVREAREEANINIDPSNLKVVHVMHRLTPKDERIDFFLVTDKWQGEASINEPDKCDDLCWFLLSDLPSNIIPYVKSAIENYERNQTFSEFGWNN